MAFVKILAEGEGFEPSVPYWTRRLSRAVHSTTLPPFHDGFAFEPCSGFLELGGNVVPCDRMRIIYRPFLLLQRSGGKSFHSSGNGLTEQRFFLAENHRMTMIA